MIRLWAVPTPQASSAAAVGQDTGGNLILTSGYGGDIFLNDIPVVSQSTDAVLHVMTKFLGLHEMVSIIVNASEGCVFGLKLGVRSAFDVTRSFSPGIDRSGC